MDFYTKFCAVTISINMETVIPYKYVIIYSNYLYFYIDIRYIMNLKLNPNIIMEKKLF